MPPQHPLPTYTHRTPFGLNLPKVGSWSGDAQFTGPLLYGKCQTGPFCHTNFDQLSGPRRGLCQKNFDFARPRRTCARTPGPQRAPPAGTARERCSGGWPPDLRTDSGRLRAPSPPSLGPPLPVGLPAPGQGVPRTPGGSLTMAAAGPPGPSLPPLPRPRWVFGGQGRPATCQECEGGLGGSQLPLKARPHVSW